MSDEKKPKGEQQPKPKAEKAEKAGKGDKGGKRRGAEGCGASVAGGRLDRRGRRAAPAREVQGARSSRP